MRKRVVIALSGGLLVMIAAWALLSYDQEPRYKGRSLSQWYSLMIRAKHGEVASSQGDEAQDAIRKIGTNAIPYLLQQVTYKHPPTPKWERRAYDLPVLGGWFANMRAQPAQKAAQAIDMFFFLGSNAAPAIPELARLINATNDPIVADHALYALTGIGDESAPAFISIISDPQHPHRRRALSKLGPVHPRKHGTNAAALLPHLVRCSNDPDPYIANLSIKAIAKLRLQPDFSVPLLMDAFQQTTNRSMRMLAAEGLGNFGAYASNAIPILREAMDDPDDHIRFWVTNALKQILDPNKGHELPASN